MKKQVPFLSFITGLGSIIGSGWLFGAAKQPELRVLWPPGHG
ncbi:TPA: hypothetical protein ACH3IE_004833 [Salmonella enterica subsp. enterica serovar Paratyphi B]